MDPNKKLPPRVRKSQVVGGSNCKATIIDFRNITPRDDTTLNQISAFYINSFIYLKDKYAFYSLCRHFGWRSISFSQFINAVKSDVNGQVTVIPITSMSQLDDNKIYTRLQPKPRNRLSVSSKDEVWQFIALGLMAFSKFPQYLNVDKYMQNQCSNLNIKPNSLASFLTKELFKLLSRETVLPEDQCNTRVLIVKWILEEKSKYPRNYIKSICWQWKGAHMTHIVLIKQEIWEKRKELLDKIKKIETDDMRDILNEIRIFEALVMPHADNEYFQYLKLTQAGNIFEGATKKDLPILMHVAVELAKQTRRNIGNFHLDKLERDKGIVKHNILKLAQAREQPKYVPVVADSRPKPQKADLNVDLDPSKTYLTDRQRRKERQENGTKKINRYAMEAIVERSWCLEDDE